MFDIGMWELMVVGVVALIVVGPKDLPKMFRTLGQVTGKIRMMAREFQTTMNAAADESGLGDVAKDLRSVGGVAKDIRKATSPKAMGLDALKDAANFDTGLEGDTSEPPKTETEKLAREKAAIRKKKIEAARKAAEERALAVEAANAAAETTAMPAASEPDPDLPQPRTGTSDT